MELDEVACRAFRSGDVAESAAAGRYVHVTDGLRRDIADQINGYFWKGE